MIVLIKPYFAKNVPHNVWVFPPLGLGYLATSLRETGKEVKIIDGTFSDPGSVVTDALREKPEIIGISSMVTEKRDAIEVAKALRGMNFKGSLVAGGPQPTIEPQAFLKHFDYVVIGEGEVTFNELVEKLLSGESPKDVKGIAYLKDGNVFHTPKREFIQDLDSVKLDRNVFENEKYIRHWEKHFGYSCTAVVTTRGCPFSCKFCSKPAFGDSFRARSAGNVVNEMEELQGLGYEKLWIADDVFTLRMGRVRDICTKMRERGVDLKWTCLSRADKADVATFKEMKNSGCEMVFFGMESGSDYMLQRMQKAITVEMSKKAVAAAKEAGLKVGSFFLLGFPGETSESMLQTLELIRKTPLDYVSFTVAYPLPGTELYDEVRVSIKEGEWDHDGQNKLKFSSTVSERKLRFAILKGNIEFRMKKLIGQGTLLSAFSKATDAMLRAI